MSSLERTFSDRIRAVIKAGLVSGAVLMMLHPGVSFADGSQRQVFPDGYSGTEVQHALYLDAQQNMMDGQKFRIKGDLDAAEKCFKEALESQLMLQSQDAIKFGVGACRASQLLGDLYYRQRNWKECLKYYSAYYDYTRKIGGDDMFGNFFRYSVALMQVGDTDKARDAYNLGVKFLIAQNSIGHGGEVIEDISLDSHMPKRRVEAAARVAVAATEVDPSMVKEECEIAIKLLPEYAPAHLKLGECYFYKDRKTANKELQTAIDLSRTGRHTVEVAQEWLKRK